MPPVMVPEVWRPDPSVMCKDTAPDALASRVSNDRELSTHVLLAVSEDDTKAWPHLKQVPAARRHSPGCLRPHVLQKGEYNPQRVPMDCWELEGDNGSPSGPLSDVRTHHSHPVRRISKLRLQHLQPEQIRKLELYLTNENQLGGGNAAFTLYYFHSPLADGMVLPSSNDLARLEGRKTEERTAL
ncbi:hypothetical protein Tco_0840543 [Tanacetum coccineum]|uniref:Uncharacterized protein n=1 Tax=Tanacetum coccineum TaxID=301880 RepID=A0ABQ5ATV4_9ASTR